MKGRIVGGRREIGQNEAWVVEKPFYVSFADGCVLGIFSGNQESFKECYQIEVPIGRGAEKTWDR